MVKRILLAVPVAAVLAAGIGASVASASAIGAPAASAAGIRPPAASVVTPEQRLLCSNDVTDVDYCGRTGGRTQGRNPFGRGPGKIDLLPGTKHGPISLTPGQQQRTAPHR